MTSRNGVHWEMCALVMHSITKRLNNAEIENVDVKEEMSKV